MARATTTNSGASTAQEIAAVVKSARDIMRKDKGLNGDLDRLPMLTWIMFLKFLDDSEQVRETESTLRGEKFAPVIEPPYRWRDWAGDPKGITGEELVAFINQDEAFRPDGERGPGLFACLRALQGADGGDRRDVVATVFRGTINRMINGYLLRDVVNKISNIHFTSSDEVHTLSFLYESMLREMRDAAGDSGEFYTPRPVVEFITNVMDPRLGETVLDPAAGTGGFLAATYDHVKKQCRTVGDREALQRGTLFGIEAKPLPYLLCQMNLVLHGLDYPEIDPLNALRFPLREIGDKDRVDVVLTNPPFGGEEEPGILSNFPDDKRTSETALLFLQFIMRKLRRSAPGKSGGRCGMVVPNGVLFGDGVCARIKEELLRDFNLQAVIRLPKGVFNPYADIPTNILFFSRPGPTTEVWYYQISLPGVRRQYTKTDPMTADDFLDCLRWWQSRSECEAAWKVGVEDIIKSGFNLDIKNPRSPSTVGEFTPRALLDQLGSRLTQATVTLDRAGELSPPPAIESQEEYTIGDLCDLIKGEYPTLKTEPGDFPLVVTAAFRRSASTFQIDAPAVCIPLVSSTGHGHAALHRIHYQEGKFALANLLVALVPKNPDVCNAKYLYYYLLCHKERLLVSRMTGTANVTLKVKDVASAQIHLPEIDEQLRMVQYLDGLGNAAEEIKHLLHGAASDADLVQAAALDELLMRAE